MVSYYEVNRILMGNPVEVNHLKWARGEQDNIKKT
jgi:hypothetical protein